MAVPYASRRRRDDASSWVLTSLAVSLLVHVVLVHYLGGIRILDVEAFRSSVTRWFRIDEKLLDSMAPDISSTTTAELPPPSVDPNETEPEPEWLATPEPVLGQIELGPEEDIAPPAIGPSQVRPPDTDPVVLHHDGPGVDVNLTDAYLGQEAPVATPTVRGQGSAAKGRRRVMRRAPGMAKPPPVSLDLAEVPAVRPAAETHASALAVPSISPRATRIELGGEPTPGILIPIEDDVGSRPPEIPKVIISERPAWKDDVEPEEVVPFRADEVDVRFNMYAEPGDEGAYFRLEIAVAEREELPVIPKDVMFVCDVSRSVGSAELEATRQAVARYLRALRRTDRFNVVVFSEQPRKLFRDFVEPSPDRIEAARRFVERIPGQVKTDVYKVLKAVVRDIAQQSIRSRPANIFFVSDGRSTSGIRDARRIVNEISAYARPNFAIFPFDVSAPRGLLSLGSGGPGDRYLLDLLAYRSRGEPVFSDDLSRSAQQQGALFGLYDNPVLMRLRLDYTNLNVAETYPALLPNLYADKPIVIYGRCKPGEDVTVRLQGKNPYAQRQLAYTHTPGAPDPAKRAIAREWARRKIHHIVSDMARLGETAALKAEIERLGRRFNVRTPYGG